LQTAGAKSKKTATCKERQKAAPAGRTEAEHLHTSSATTSEYRLSSFDAQEIIYPGSSYDSWWDMPQLISQVSAHDEASV
jgi:hypothetical protein